MAARPRQQSSFGCRAHSALRSRIATVRRPAAAIRSPSGRVLACYVLARLISVALLVTAVRQLRGVRLLAGGPFRLWESALLRWDAVYYASIARSGYPTHLPVDSGGDVLPNVWAFLPAFPLSAGAVAHAIDVHFVWVAMALNLIAGGVTAVSLRALFLPFVGPRAALASAVIWSVLPLSFLLLVPYSEAVHLAFAAACLLAMTRGRLMAAAALLVGASISRGSALPLAVALAVRACLEVRGIRALREEAAATSGRLASAAIAAVVAILAPWIWTVVAAVATGRPNAFAASHEAWGYRVGFVAMLDAWRGAIDHDGIALLANPTVLVLLATAALTVVCIRTRALPLELKVYAAAAALLLGALAQPGAVAFGSVPRFAFGILTLPMAMALCLPRRWMVAVAVAASIGVQYLWVLNIWSGRLGVAP